MKKIFILLILFANITSCTKSEDSTDINKLEGKWNLIKVTCECPTLNLDIGNQIWTFRLQQNNLNVVNNLNTQMHTIKESGNYPITITDNNVTISSIEYKYYFMNEKLYLADHPDSDGPLLEFIRN